LFAETLNDDYSMVARMQYWRVFRGHLVQIKRMQEPVSNSTFTPRDTSGVVREIEDSLIQLNAQIEATCKNFVSINE